MSNAPRILFVTQDKGGFNAISPVYMKLKREHPRGVWGVFEPISKKELMKVFALHKPDVLVVGTSSGLSVDKLATGIARTLAIPSVAVMDFWSNYTLRFSDPGTANLVYLPDRIFVMDDICKREMVKEGFDPKRIVVTGNPYFETFFRKRSVIKGKPIISFLSQPFSELIREDKGFDFGFDDIEAFRDVVKALERLGVTEEIVVKLHPRTKNTHAYDALIKASRLSIRVDLKTPTTKIIERSSLVIGMNTVALFEAALMGKNVLSYQPNLNRPDPLISNRLGLSVPVYKKKDLLVAIRRLRSGKKPVRYKNIRDRYVHGHATRNVINLIRNT
jgi:hypothetical protein